MLHGFSSSLPSQSSNKDLAVFTRRRCWRCVTYQYHLVPALLLGLRHIKHDTMIVKGSQRSYKWENKKRNEKKRAVWYVLYFLGKFTRFSKPVIPTQIPSTRKLQLLQMIWMCSHYAPIGSKGYVAITCLAVTNYVD